jgi:hypothetical protein
MRPRACSLAASCAMLVVVSVSSAQQPAGSAIARIEVRPATLTLRVNDTATIVAVAYDSSGARLDVPLALYSSERRRVGVDSLGHVTAYRPGDAPVRIVALPVAGAGVQGEAMVTVAWPGLDRIELTGGTDQLFAGTAERWRASVIDAAGGVRDGIPVAWASDAPAIASVDQFGAVTAHRVGRTVVRVSGGGVAGRRSVQVVANPVRTLGLTASADGGRTGDVIRFTVVARDGAGRPVANFPVRFSVQAEVEDTVIASEAPAQVDQDGRFVAQRAGDYTVVATAGALVATRTVAITHRFTSIRLNTGKGHGAVSDVHTSDLWVWAGQDGRDYAATGTWSANGVAYFWDVTDPANPVKVDSIQVDARTVNDVKVDAERGICVITREGASNRKNGFVVLDCRDPHHVQVLSRFDDQLWGGVHNVFIWNHHVFAINNGRRFDIISIEDPSHPVRVGTYELDTPGHGIHDIWVQDGIACTSNWQDGALLIDVGNGKWGGSLAHPVKIAQYHYPIGATHSCFQYHSQSAGGRWYAFVGDEQFPYNLGDDEPDEPGGYIHIVDFTDLDHPREVARYQVPEAGPHNFWVEHDTLYVAYYNAGLRVVDVSGELMGNLYDQGRELVRFEPRDPTGKVPNAPMTWGPQPFHGHVFVSDYNSGLWTVQLPERQPAAVP